MSLEEYAKRIYEIEEMLKNDDYEDSLSRGDAIVVAHYICILKAKVDERIKPGSSKKRKIITETKTCVCGKPKAVYKGPNQENICQACYRKNKK
jgi:hypothetical protein